MCKLNCTNFVSDKLQSALIHGKLKGQAISYPLILFESLKFKRWIAKFLIACSILYETLYVSTHLDVRIELILMTRGFQTTLTTH